MMGQDRLIGAAGEGSYRAVRGWAGRPEYGNSLLVKAPLEATDVERLDLGLARSAHRGLVRLPERRDGPRRRHAPAPRRRRRRPSAMRRPPRSSSGSAARPGGRGRGDGRLQRGSRRADVCADDRCRVPVRLRRRERRRAGRDVALGLQAPAMDTDGDPDCLDYIWVRGDGPGRGRARSPGTARTRRTRRSTRATISASAPTSRSAGRDRRDADRRAVADAPTRPPRRLPPRPGEQPRGDAGRARRSPAATASSSMSAARPTASRSSSTTRPSPASRVDRSASTPSPPRRSRRSASRPSPTSSSRSVAGRSSTSSSRATTTDRSSRCSRPVAARTSATRSCRRSRPRPSSGSPGLAPAWPRWLNSETLDALDVASATELRCRGIASQWEAVHARGDRAGPGRRARGRGLDGPPAHDVRSAVTARRRRGLRRGMPRSTAEGITREDVVSPVDDGLSCPNGADRTEDHRVADRADLVIVGAGTVGGWASVFAAASGAGRVVVVERGLAGMGASSRAAGIVRAQGGTPATVALGRWSIDFYNGQQAAYGTDSGFRELGYLILAVTEDDETAGSRARRDAAGPGTRRPLAGCRRGRPTGVTLAADGHRGGSYIETDGCIDPPRNVRAYSLAMQAAGVELRERTAFTGLRTTPTGDGGTRVTAVETDDGRHRDRPGAADRRSEPAGGRAARRPAHPRRRGAPHGGRARAACRPSTRPDADGLRHRPRPVLATRGRRAPLRLERSRRAAGRGARHRLVVLRADARPARDVRAGHDGARAASDLGRDHRLHARPPAHPRSGDRRRTAPASTA